MHLRVTIFLIVFSLILFSCTGNDLTAPDRFQTAYDLANDLTWHRGSLYYTNYDDSGEEGDQMYMFRVDTTGNLLDRFNLQMNGQGYIAIASDGDFLYLLSEHSYGMLLKCTPAGEWVAAGSADVEGWTPGGIVYREDVEELIAAFMKINNPDSMAFVQIDRGTLSMDTSSVAFHRYPDITGIISLTWDPVKSSFFGLGEALTGERQLLELDGSYNRIRSQTVVDSVRGITFAYPDALLAIGSHRTIFPLVEPM